MARAQDITKTIALMSKPKTKRIAFVPKLEEDLEATKERKAKDDYEGPHTKRRKCKPLETLRKSEDIDAEGETTALKWLSDYEFARFGYADFMNEPLPDNYVKGDMITFSLSRTFANERISIISEILGESAHRFLEHLLFEELSFSAMARDLFPNVEKTSADKAIKQRAAVLLQILPNAYQTACKVQKRNKEALSRK